MDDTLYILPAKPSAKVILQMNEESAVEVCFDVSKDLKKNILDLVAWKQNFRRLLTGIDSFVLQTYIRVR
jgi:hypothetical protein